MKVLFTADIHIKLGQKNVPIEWARNRYRMLFDELSRMQEKVDMVVLGGDIFDKLPNMEELELYFELLAKLTCPTIIYSGNHEAIKKNTTFLTNLKSVSSKIGSRITILDDFYSLDNMDFIPYNKLKEYHPSSIDMHGEILFTHVRGEIPPHVKPEVSLELFDRWKVVLAGDLHSYSNSQRNILYPGSPITTSFHRNLVSTGVIILDTGTLEHTWVELKLPQLLRKTISAGEDMPATEFHHTIYEVEGNMTELQGMVDTTLLDKKVVKRNIDTSLILTPELTLDQEVDEYLRYILQLDDNSVLKVLKELNNHIGKLQE